MPSVVAKQDTAATAAGGKKQTVMGRLKSKFTNPLAKKKDAAPNEGDLRGMQPPQSEQCNQGSTPRLDSSTDDDSSTNKDNDDDDVNVEQHDDDDVNAVDHGEPRDDDVLEGATLSETVLSNNDQPCNLDSAGEDQDDELLVSAPALADLIVVGKTPSKLHATSSPKKRQFSPTDHASSFAPDTLVSPPETRRSSETLTSSPSKRTSIQPVTERAEPNDQNDRPDAPTAKPRKSRVVATFNEDAPILASANAVAAADNLVDERLGSSDAAPEATSVSKPDSDFDAGAAITSVFGERVARLLGADPWGDRQDGFDAISLFAKKLDPTAPGAPTPVAVLTASLAAINCGVVDRVAPVMYCSLECLQHVLGVLAPLIAKNKRLLQHAPLVLQLSALQTSLLAKLSDSNKRTQREAIQGLVRLAKAPRLQTMSSLATAFDNEPLDKSRLELIHELVAELGYADVPIDKILAWTVPALKIADEKTRKLALDIAAAAILQAPDQQAAVESLTGIKPAMLKVLQRRIEELKASQAPSANQTESSSGDGMPDGDEVIALFDVPKDDDASVTTLLATVMREAETVAGPVAWRKLESKTWSDRKEALVDIEKVVDDHKSELRDVKPVLGSHTQQQYLAYNGLIYHSLNDSIAPVVNQAIDFYSTLIKTYGAHIDWRDTPIKDLTMQSIMRLLSGMQKPNNRTSKGSCRAILKLARLNTHTMQCVVTCVFAKDAEPLVQMQVLRLLVPEFGLTSDPTTDIPGVNINSTLVLNAVAAALAHSNEKVRKAAMDVALCTQRLIGKIRVLKRLKDVKPATLKELEKNFVEVEPPTVDRPATVQQTPTALGAGLGEVTASRRLLSSAPVAGGKSVDDDGGAMDWTPRGNSMLSKDEESFMDSILDG
ncbi:hypothetical protein H310_14016 [Aphanomyces invadans]|uniref:TOG domain-containing protein n=1 Tax=Aphanomyces invadans TaxID=157072 RepID=A0A024TDU7_9STRA|nr:hypothetical protein H310_14016 [Aphanomyces invadans]ETV91497.1 hypothetical protein H310_14016 [Aphanomyces invadans]|eukprot:XP_008879949.1 hypothetical protein H310_14016 [Aphanomyces invadans]